MKYIKTINEHFNEKFVEYYIEKLRLELEKLANGGYFYFSEDIKARKRFGCRGVSSVFESVCSCSVKSYLFDSSSIKGNTLEHYNLRCII